MPVYELKCECGERFDVICAHDKRDAQPCPKCGKTKAQPQVSMFATDRYFSGEGSVSLREGCHPRDVLAQRQLYGDTVNIDDRGDFSFDGRAQYKRFAKKKRAIEKAERQVKASKPSRLEVGGTPPAS